MFMWPDRLIADRSLYDQGHWHRRQDWTDRLSSDRGTCSKMIDTWWVPGGALTPVQIACFPGSGSKWIMEMILFLTGLSARLVLRKVSV